MNILVILISIFSYSYLTNASHYISNQNFKIKNSIINHEDLALCRLECEKLASVFGCYCDDGCNVNKDCCSVDNKICAKYFNNEENEHMSLYNNKTANMIFGSCCKEVLPLDCFCDPKCFKLNDCCKDFGKCLNKNKKVNFSYSQYSNEMLFR